MPGKYLPSEFSNPAGLAQRVFRRGGAEGRFALWLAALGLLFSPLDLLLSPFERRLYAEASEPRLPMVLVVGPPRSGTTLVAQVLIRYLPVEYLSNLTSLFPRSPLTAMRWFGDPARPRLNFKAYYGRTARLAGPNDALYIWDRWTEGGRREIPKALTPGSGDRIRAFFGALEQRKGRPVVAKNNRLNTFASLVAQELPTAHFLCLDRDPVFLAQSLLAARSDVAGNPGIPYGVSHRSAEAPGSEDPVTDVCHQVVFHQRTALEQQRLIGEERFHFVSYEDFCRDPHETLEKVADLLTGSDQIDSDAEGLGPFEVSRHARLDRQVLSRIERELAELGSCRAVGTAP